MMISPLSARLFLLVTVSLWLGFGVVFGDNDGKQTNDDGIAKKAYVIPIRDQIGSPILDILRRGLKNAIRDDFDVVILDMDTPGGELGVTLEIMEALDRFEGRTIVYVNKEAISAGAYISIAADDIAFAPAGIIGAAEAVSGGGQNIDASMKRKINSYLKAKIRNYAQDHRYRRQVMEAMMDANASLVIDGIRPTLDDDNTTFVQSDNELLTLTASQAVKTYGNPPQTLLGIGIFDSIDDLLKAEYPEGYVVERMELSWSEELGLFLNRIGPIIMGIGLLLLVIEFKTPGFGFFGVMGILLMLVFFGSKYVAGLAGFEEILVFLLGVALVFVEIFLFPGTMIFALLGVCCMLGSLLWAMADIWPTPDFEWSFNLFYDPFIDLGLGLLVAIGLGAALARFLPKSLFLDRLVLAGSVGQLDPLVTGGASSKDNPSELPAVGSKGRTVSALFPSGTVEIKGRRYQAQTHLESLPVNTAIRVTKRGDFNLVVEPDEDL